MAIVITNGTKYICYGKNNCINKTTNEAEANIYPDVELAVKEMMESPAKTQNYFVYDTETNCICWRWFPSKWAKAMEAKRNEHIEDECSDKSENGKHKRKVFTPEERKAIYRKTKGRCYICGEFVDYDSFEIEHRIPLAKGGTNDFENTFCSCHICNTMKGSIIPVDLMEKIKQIHLYQIRRKCGKNRNSLKWKIVYKALQKLS